MPRRLRERARAASGRAHASPWDKSHRSFALVSLRLRSSEQDVSQDDRMVVQLVSGSIQERDWPVAGAAAQLAYRIGVACKLNAIAASELNPAPRVVTEPCPEP